MLYGEFFIEPEGTSRSMVLKSRSEVSKMPSANRKQYLWEHWGLNNDGEWVAGEVVFFFENNKQQKLMFCIADPIGPVGVPLEYPFTDINGIPENFRLQGNNGGLFVGELPIGIKEGDLVRCRVTESSDPKALTENPFPVRAIDLCKMIAISSTWQALAETEGVFLIPAGTEEAALKDAQEEAARKAEVLCNEEYRVKAKELEEKLEGDRLQAEEKLKQHLEALDADIASAQKDLEKIKKENDDQIKRNKGLHAKAQKFDERVRQHQDKLTSWGINIEEASRSTNLPLPEKPTIMWNGGDFNQLAAQIQKYLYNNSLFYRKALIEDFLTLLCTHDLILLSGPPGTGKSSLVAHVAEAMGGVCRMIEVRPSWTTSEDLLGCYNPLHRTYDATAFVEALREARQNPDRLFFICLEEMNLARPEYYMADLLSKMARRDEPITLALLPDAETKLLKTELDKRSQKPGSATIDDELKIERLRQLYLTAGQPLVIPDNVRLIGTLNIDETTFVPSPKVLDRSHVMRFVGPPKNEQVAKEIAPSVSGAPLWVDPDSLPERKAYPMAHENLSTIEATQEWLAGLGIETAGRLLGQATLYYELFCRNFGEKNADVALHNILLHKILPRLTFDGAVEKHKIHFNTFNERPTKTKLPDGSKLANAVISRTGDKKRAGLLLFDTEMTRLSEMLNGADKYVNYWS